VDVTEELAVRCPACDAPLLSDDRFCEACGAAVAVAEQADEACHACGAPPGDRTDDGYCSRCGVRARVPARADLDLGVAAAVSEQGRSHHRNEDAFRLERVGEDGFVAVVCDGISTAAAGDAAARAAADATAAALARAIREGEDLVAATGAAVGAAHDAVGLVPATTRTAVALPSCTLVSAAGRDGELAVGWVGDSRAYWLALGDERQLTVDDSWATEQVAEGVLTSREAFADHRAHAITRWVGADAPIEAPRVATLTPATAGRLLLCSDGLWNAAPAPADLAQLIAALGADAPPATVAHHLADAAGAAGSRDDITLIVVDIEPRGGLQP
jgi:serine/threonine protein phosphatase PrpC